MTLEYQSTLERLRAICLALPGTAERLSHGTPGWHIEKDRFFAYFWHHIHGDTVTAAIVKTSGAEEQAMLIELDADTYYRPPYYGPSGWIGIHLDHPDTDWNRIADRVAISWELVAPRRLLEAGGR